MAQKRWGCREGGGGGRLTAFFFPKGGGGFFELGLTKGFTVGA